VAFVTVTLAERPDLMKPMWDMVNTWPPFMRNDPVGNRLFGRAVELFPAHQLVVLENGAAGGGTVIGKVNAIPFAWDGSDDDLPDRGWDAVLERGVRDHERGTPPGAVSLLEARLDPAHVGAGRSAVLLTQARDNASRLGYTDLLGPVRPTLKAAEPRTPIGDYAFRTREDGLPADPWMRTHVRVGARTVKVCPASMTIPGTLADWRRWTGLPFDTSGDLDVPGALTPVHVSVEQDHAVYVEPNVWMHHRL
jgi:hypothetical protein